jgi:hypothetical protein
MIEYGRKAHETDTLKYLPRVSDSLFFAPQKRGGGQMTLHFVHSNKLIHLKVRTTFDIFEFYF